MMKNPASSPDNMFSEWSLATYLACHHAPGLSLKKVQVLMACCQGQGEEILVGRQWSALAKAILLKQLGCLPKIDWSAAEADWRWVNAHPSRRLVSLGDVDYPELLAQIARPPLLLYAQGNLEILQARCLALVGARKPTAYGLDKTQDLAKALSMAGYTVVSGLAEGIDAAAHRGALLESGKTVAVLGHGLSHCFPRQHVGLKNQIVEEGGLLLSEFSPDIPVKKHHFPQRNRIVSGLSVGVVVTQAMIKSGSLITARYALSEGREIFALPGPTDLPQSLGCHALIQQGATLVNQASDIWENLPAHWQAHHKRGGYQGHFLF